MAGGLAAFAARFTLALFLVAFSFSAFAAGRFAVMQGATDQTSTQIAILAPRSAALEFRLKEGAASFRSPAKITRAARGFSSLAVIQAAFTDLKAGHVYTLEITDKAGKIIDRRQLATLPENPQIARIAIVSCSNDKFVRAGAPLWAHLYELQPHAIFMVGDNVYADKGGAADPEQLWRRYAETREALPIFRAPRLIPVFATWDDHDYGANDADFRYPYKNEARSVFQAFFPREPLSAGVRRGPGVATRVDFFKQRFFFMDNRTFRNTRDRAGVLTHWGDEQNRWLAENLRLGSGPIWLINGSQFFGGYHEYESFEREHPTDMRRLLRELSRSSWPTLFISGDRHLSEILDANWPELGHRSVELTSSGIHSYVGELAARRLPAQPAADGPIVGPFVKMNFMMVEIDLRSSLPGLRISATVFGPNREAGFNAKYEIRR